MAQTISIQKGTVSCNWSLNSAGTSTPSQTLFTQSSGIGARVIVNSLELYSNTAAAVYIAFYIVNGTTGIASCVGMLHNANSIGNYAIVPQNQSLQSINGTNVLNNSVAFMAAGSGRVNIAADNPSSIRVISPSAQNYAFYLPGNFWIANGDSLTVRGYWDNTGSTYYNFTVITES